MMKFLYWTPRILSLLFVAFLSIFAFDVFEEYQGWAVVLALFMHLLPSFALLAVTAVAWQRELVGGILFIVAGILFIALMLLFRREAYPYFFIVVAPALVIGILYLLSWRQKRTVAPSHAS